VADRLPYKNSRMTMARALAALAVLGVMGPALAGGWVEFDDGRRLEVEGFELDGALLALELEGGGRMVIPTCRVLSLSRGSDELTGEAYMAEGWRQLAGSYADLIAAAADEHGIDPALLASVATVESGWDPRAVSPKGARGLLQLMPETAERFGVSDVFEPAENVRGGAAYLRWLLDRYDGDTQLALAAYNAGEGAVDRHRGVPPYRETRAYVSKVIDGLDSLAGP